MHSGKGQDHFADEFALGCGQFQKSLKGFALQIASALLPALLLGAQMGLHMGAKAQLMRVQL